MIALQGSSSSKLTSIPAPLINELLHSVFSSTATKRKQWGFCRRRHNDYKWVPHRRCAGALEISTEFLCSGLAVCSSGGLHQLFPRCRNFKEDESTWIRRLNPNPLVVLTSGKAFVYAALYPWSWKYCKSLHLYFHLHAAPWSSLRH